MQKFNSKTKFKNDTYYIFDNINANIYSSDCCEATEKKYFTICGSNDEVCRLDTAFLLKNLRNVTLDFCGAVITLHGKLQPFIIDCCEHITIKKT